MATGLISSKLAVTLSPGMTISMPFGSVTVPAAKSESLPMKLQQNAKVDAQRAQDAQVLKRPLLRMTLL